MKSWRREIQEKKEEKNAHHVLDGGAVPHDDSTTGIRALTLSLGVDTGQVQRFPNLLQQVIHVEVKLAAEKKQVSCKFKRGPH